MRVEGRAPLPPARERYGGARVAAACMGGVVGWALMRAHLHLSPAPEGLPVGEWLFGASFAGFYVGWRMIGMSLGRGWGWALVRGISGGLIAAGAFCALGGLKKGADAMSTVRFGETMALLHFVMQQTLDLAGKLLDSPAGMAAPVAAVLVSIASEALHLRWGWHGVEAMPGRDAVSARWRPAPELTRRR